MNTNLLPPLHDVDAPPMSVSYDAIIERSTQIRRRGRHRFAMGVAAACTAGTLAVGGFALAHNTRSESVPGRPVGPAPVSPLGSYFDGVPIEEPVSSAGDSPGFSLKETAGGQIAITQDRSASGPLTMSHPSPAVWLARSGKYSASYVALPRDVRRVWAVTRLSPSGNGSSNNAVRLPSGRVGVFAVGEGVPTAYAFERTDGAFGSTSGIVVHGRRIDDDTSIIVLPGAKMWALQTNDQTLMQASETGNATGEVSTASFGNGKTWTTLAAALLPADATDIRVKHKPGASNPTIAGVPGSGYQVVFVTSKQQDTATSPLTSVSWTEHGTRHTATG